MTGSVQPPVPSDPRSVVYALFYLLGIGTLLPWNLFLAGTSYFTAARRLQILYNMAVSLLSRLRLKATILGRKTP